jgi:acetolactate synthase-1/2/3 large subunit
MTNGGSLLVKALQEHNVRRVFSVAGESYLPVLNGLLDAPEIQSITCRHESGATFMAEAYGQLTNTPGIAMVTRGPGACNGSIGVHTAHQSSTPMILFSGLIGIADRDKEAFQEFDIAQMFDSLSKWSAVIDSIDRIPEYVSRAFHIAQSGRPGPVVLGLPEEILFSKTADQQAQVIPRNELKPSDTEMNALRDALARAKAPVILVGGGGWRDEDCDALAQFSSATHMPVATSFRRQDLFSHTHGNYIGELGTGPNPALVERVRSADLVLVIGARLNEITTQIYTLFRKGQQIIHVYPDASVFGQSVIPTMTIQAHVGPFVTALAGGKRPDGRVWAGWRDDARKAYQDWTKIDAAREMRWEGADMSVIFDHIRETLPKDAIVTTDAGNFSGWCQRYLRYGRPGRLLAPVCGAMGYAVPSVISASLEHPDRLSVGFCGDGGFMMSGQEMATALHHGAKPIIIVCNNSMYGTIRMHQEKEYPGRVSATGLSNPDFVKLAESYGAFSARVEKTSDFAGIWQAARSSGRMSLIEIKMDPRQITTNSKI